MHNNFPSKFPIPFQQLDFQIGPQLLFVGSWPQFTHLLYVDLLGFCGVAFCLENRMRTLSVFWYSVSVLQGGMKAVVWTDALQGIIYVAGIITILVVVSAGQTNLGLSQRHWNFKPCSVIGKQRTAFVLAGVGESWWSGRSLEDIEGAGQAWHVEVRFVFVVFGESAFRKKEVSFKTLFAIRDFGHLYIFRINFEPLLFQLQFEPIWRQTYILVLHRRAVHGCRRNSDESTVGAKILRSEDDEGSEIVSAAFPGSGTAGRRNWHDFSFPEVSEGNFNDLWNLLAGRWYSWFQPSPSCLDSRVSLDSRCSLFTTRKVVTRSERNRSPAPIRSVIHEKKQAESRFTCRAFQLEPEFMVHVSVLSHTFWKIIFQLLPRFVMEEVDYPGLPGIFLSILFAGALRWVFNEPNWINFAERSEHWECVYFVKPQSGQLVWYKFLWIALFGSLPYLFCSTLSSAISALAAVTWKDMIEPFRPNMREIHKTIITKILCRLTFATSGTFGVRICFVSGESVSVNWTIWTSFPAVVFGAVATAFAFGFKYVKGHVLQVQSCTGRQFYSVATILCNIRTYIFARCRFLFHWWLDLAGQWLECFTQDFSFPVSTQL